MVEQREHGAWRFLVRVDQIVHAHARPAGRDGYRLGLVEQRDGACRERVGVS